LVTLIHGCPVMAVDGGCSHSSFAIALLVVVLDDDRATRECDGRDCDHRKDPPHRLVRVPIDARRPGDGHRV
jgi:hypothetical protein